jgi:hypothetical protein
MVMEPDRLPADFSPADIERFWSYVQPTTAAGWRHLVRRRLGGARGLKTRTVIEENVPPFLPGTTVVIEYEIIEGRNVLTHVPEPRW